MFWPSVQFLGRFLDAWHEAQRVSLMYASFPKPTAPAEKAKHEARSKLLAGPTVQAELMAKLLFFLDGGGLLDPSPRGAVAAES